MKATELKKLIRTEVLKEISKKPLKESFQENNTRHGKAAIALSEFLKTKIAKYMSPMDCAELLHLMALELKKYDDFEDGLEYYSSYIK